MSVAPDGTRGTELLRRWRGMVVPVEDPDHAASRRERMVGRVGGLVRQASSQRRTRRLRRRAVAALALAAAVCLGVGLWKGATSTPTAADSAELGVEAVAARPAAHLRVTDGTVVAGVGERAEVVAQARLVDLQPGDEVSTAADGRAALELSGQARVELSHATRLRIIDTQLSAQRLSLLSGRLDVDIPQDAPEQQLAIDTPDAEIHVIGTVFSVELRRAGDSGVVGTIVDVARGEVRVIRRGGTGQALLAGKHWVSNDELLPAATECADDPAEQEPAGRAAAGARNPGSAAIPSRSELAAQNRLYQAALDARNAGQNARALRLLEQFLARHPASPLAQEAQVERFRTLRLMGRGTEAARQARRYLAEHDAGYAREEARELILAPPPETP